jgi:hypothetical protein
MGSSLLYLTCKSVLLYLTCKSEHVTLSIR